MEEKKPKRKYTRRAKVEPLAVYSVMVTVRRGRKTETIYGESVHMGDGCLVVVSMDGPQPLVEKTRYIPLGSAEIEVCQRVKPSWEENAYRRMVQPVNEPWLHSTLTPPPYPPAQPQPSGPRIIAGPLEMARSQPQPVRREVRDIVERNADGVPVVSAGFLDGSPT